MKKYLGCYTALITPFYATNIDFISLAKMLDLQISAGISGVILCGTTGESATLDTYEKRQIFEFAKKHCQNKIQLIAGTGSNSTKDTINETLLAQDCGMDAAMVVSPYYNKPTQEGLLAHYTAIHNATNIDIIIYNVPSRTAVDISNDTIIKLTSLTRVRGLKDATANLARVPEILLNIPESFSLLSGEDMTANAFNASGGCGVISVLSNIMPKECTNLQNLSREGNFTQAAILQAKLSKITNLMFVNTNPIPVKYAAYLMGLCNLEYRLPLTNPPQQTINLLTSEMKNLSLIQTS